MVLLNKKKEKEKKLINKSVVEKRTWLVVTCTLSKMQPYIGAMAIPHGNNYHHDWSARVAHVFSYMFPVLV